MTIFTTIKDIQDYVSEVKKSGLTIGFVPTMGALHDGHFALIKNARENNQLVIVSIFINPIQFNNQTDLNNYPISLEKDKQMLQKIGCDILFTPSVKEIYPEYPTVNILKIDLGNLGEIMEAKYRPGHFEGVVTVVDKLFSAVPAHNAYFGSKDLQQLLIIRKLVEARGIPINIYSYPTVREKDGLALSSRNMKLNTEEREQATLIYKALLFVKENYINGINKAITGAKAVISQGKNLKIEYLKVATLNLEEVTVANKNELLVVCCSVFCGKTRLIDNLMLNE